MAHCLSPLVRNPSARFELWNVGAGTRIATRVLSAFDSATRRQGLLGRTGIPPGDALVLAPCSSVHTFFMQFPIDLLFIDRAGRVIRTSAAVGPWRIRVAWRAFAVVELATGTVAASDTQPGHIVELKTIV